MINPVDLSPDEILKQMNEPRPLPLGRQEFHDWADRIISGACIPGGEDDLEAFKEGQKSALTHMIMHMKPTESHAPDAYFIHSLRKAAANQVAHAVGVELLEKAKKRTAEREAEAASSAEGQKANLLGLRE